MKRIANLHFINVTQKCNLLNDGFTSNSMYKYLISITHLIEQQRILHSVSLTQQAS